MWDVNDSCWWQFHLGTPKKPPFRAPRQEADTRIGINEDKLLIARLAKVCNEETLQMNSPLKWYTNSDVMDDLTLMCAVRLFAILSTNHSHSFRHEQLVCRHHCIVSNVDQHIKHCHCHHRQDDCQWDVSVHRKVGVNTPSIFKIFCFFVLFCYLFGFITSSVT